MTQYPVLASEGQQRYSVKTNKKLKVYRKKSLLPLYFNFTAIAVQQFPYFTILPPCLPLLIVPLA
jgi:hypothetical protein